MSDPLTILTLTPIGVGLILLVLPQLLPGNLASSVRKFSRNVSFGVSMALFAFATYLSFTTFGGIDWLDINMGEYELMLAQVFFFSHHNFQLCSVKISFFSQFSIFEM